MKEKTERDLIMVEEVLNGRRDGAQTDAAKKFGVSIPFVHHVCKVMFLKLLPDEELRPGETSLRYLSVKVAADMYRERLRQKLYDRTLLSNGGEKSGLRDNQSQRN